MLFTNVVGILKVLCGWVVRVWNGFFLVFADIRDWVPGKECLCKSYRVNNKFFEFRGRSNKAGIFVEIAVYYGGARCGWVMVPASSNQSGWRLFSKNLDCFLVGSNTVWVKGRTSDEVAAGGPLDGGGQVGKKFVKISNQQKLRKFEFSRANSGLNVLKGDTVVAVSSINRRPTREFKFELTSAKLAMRVSKLVGGKRVATWMNPNTHHKSNNSGPSLLKSVSGLDKAHVVDQRGKAQGEVSYPLDLGLSVSCFQNERVVGKSSKPPMKSTVMLEVSTTVFLLISSSDQASELHTSILMRALADPETGKAPASSRSSIVVVLGVDMAISAMGSVSNDLGFTSVRVVSSTTTLFENVVSPILDLNPWVVQNRFSLLFDLGNGVEDELVEGEVHEVAQRSNHHDEMTLQRLVDSGGEFQTCEESNSLVDLPLEKEFQTCGREEKDFCVLECDPLSWWEPNDLRELVLLEDFTEGTQVLESGTPSN